MAPGGRTTFSSSARSGTQGLGTFRVKGGIPRGHDVCICKHMRWYFWRIMWNTYVHEDTHLSAVSFCLRDLGSLHPSSCPRLMGRARNRLHSEVVSAIQMTLDPCNVWMVVRRASCLKNELIRTWVHLIFFRLTSSSCSPAEIFCKRLRYCQLDAGASYRLFILSSRVLTTSVKLVKQLQHYFAPCL